MAVPPKPMDLLTEVVQQLGLDVTYEYDGFVFVTHNLFILKFTDPEHSIDLYFNEDIEEEKAQTLMALIEAAAQDKGLQVGYKGAFCLTPQKGDDIELEFFDLSDE